MGPVFVVEDSCLVRLIIGVAADVRPPVDQQHLSAMLRGEALSENGAGKTGSDDQIIVLAAVGGPGGRDHSAATSRAGEVAPVRVPSTSAMRPAMRAWVVSQHEADSMRSASASQPLSGLRESSRA